MSSIDISFPARPVRHPVGSPGDRIAETSGSALEAYLFESDLYFAHSRRGGAAAGQWHEWVRLAEEILAVEERRRRAAG